MKTLQIKSKYHPFSVPNVIRPYSRLIGRARIMGLISNRTPIKELADESHFFQLLKRIREVGIANNIDFRMENVSSEELAADVQKVYDAMAESPVPHSEWPSLEKILGAELLARLVGISLSSIHRYRSGSRTTPDKIAARLHFLALVVEDLAGIYNEYGIRRWFDRKRTLLDGLSPSEILTDDWDIDSSGPTKVKNLAHTLVALSAT